MAFQGIGIQGVTLAFILGALGAIIYSLRVLVLLERRISRMDENIEKMAMKIAKEEFKIESMMKKKR